MSWSLSEVRCTPSIVIHTFGKEDLSVTESGQCVRHGDQVQLCLIRSHPGPAFLRKPESSLIERAPAWKHLSCRITPRQDKPPHFLPLCSMRCAG